MKNRVLRWLTPTFLAIAVAGCSSGSSNGTSTTTTPGSSSSVSSSSTTSTTIAVKTYMSASGSGNKTSPSVTLPKKWQLKWQWLCHGEKKTFVVTATGGSAGAGKQIINQTGEGGGGEHPVALSGTVRFAVTTDPVCSWKLSVIS